MSESQIRLTRADVLKSYRRQRLREAALAALTGLTTNGYVPGAWHEIARAVWDAAEAFDREERSRFGDEQPGADLPPPAAAEPCPRLRLADDGCPHDDADNHGPLDHVLDGPSPSRLPRGS